jgi:ectoine hydroxylase-related dioxygenase (phytanoyl-CoA dioxygenase family)
MKIYSKSEIKSLKTLNSVLLKDGIFKVNSYLSASEVEELKKEVLEKHLTHGKSYPFGSSFAINNPESLLNESLIKKIFSKPWMKELFLSFNKGVLKGFFDSIYSTHDYIYDGSIGRNGYLHFDRNASLKYFLYLNDVTKENGAFFIQPNSHRLGKQLRKKAWSNLIPSPNDSLSKKIFIRLIGKSFAKVKNRIELDYPEFYDPQKLIPVEGKAGTLIVFDSDIFHQGGKINKKGVERIVLRMHNYLS